MRKGKKGEAFVKDRILPFFLFCLSLLFLWNTPYLQAQQAAPPSPTKTPTSEQIQKAREMLKKGVPAEIPKEIPTEKALKEEVEEPEAKPKEEVVPAKEKSQIEISLSGRISTTISTDLTQFGYELFRTAVSTFAPVTDVPVGPEYIIGPGDSFNISLWGRIERFYQAEVDRNGEITLPKIGTLKVWGLTFSELRKYLLSKFSRHYKGFHMNVVMGKLRTIRVFVIGEVVTPGSYTLSSLATVYNAFFAAGGPLNGGR